MSTKKSSPKIVHTKAVQPALGPESCCASRQSVQEDVGFLGPLLTAWSMLGALAESLGVVLVLFSHPVWELSCISFSSLCP